MLLGYMALVPFCLDKIELFFASTIFNQYPTINPTITCITLVSYDLMTTFFQSCEDELFKEKGIKLPEVVEEFGLVAEILKPFEHEIRFNDHPKVPTFYLPNAVSDKGEQYSKSCER